MRNYSDVVIEHDSIDVSLENGVNYANPQFAAINNAPNNNNLPV